MHSRPEYREEHSILGRQDAFVILRVSTMALVAAFAGNASTTLKIGVGRIVPVSYFDENGNAAGFAVDVLNEAARREQIPVSWVRLAKSPTEDLRAGVIDLLAAN